MIKDPHGTLEAVAKMGYEIVEAANYSEGKFYGMEPKAFTKAVESVGLKLVSSHNHVNEMTAQRIADDAAEAGLKYVILPSMSLRNLDVVKKYVWINDHNGTVHGTVHPDR